MSFNDAAFTVLLQCKTLSTIKWGCYNTPKEKQILFGKEDDLHLLFTMVLAV